MPFHELHQLEARMQRLEDDVNEFKDLIIGTAAFPGLRMQLDRLEQLSNNRVWYIRQILILLIPLVLKTLFDLYRLLT